MPSMSRRHINDCSRPAQFEQPASCLGPPQVSRMTRLSRSPANNHADAARPLSPHCAAQPQHPASTGGPDPAGYAPAAIHARGAVGHSLLLATEQITSVRRSTGVTFVSRKAPAAGSRCLREPHSATCGAACGTHTEHTRGCRLAAPVADSLNSLFQPTAV